MRREPHASVVPPLAILVVSLATAVVMAFGTVVRVDDGSHNALSGGSATQGPDYSTVIGEYQAVSQSTDANRSENLALATEALNGCVIEPGEALALNNVLGDTSADPSYKEASAISGIEVVTEQGGGVCQVASALYIAALEANLDIEERHPHTIACDYAPMGLDATLAYGQKDLVIRNNGDSPVQIEASAEGQSVTVSITGKPLADNAIIDVHAEVVNRQALSVDEIAAEYGPDATSLYDSATAFEVKAYRVKYIDGTPVETKLISTDRYLSVPVEPSVS